ncbi:FAD-binding oxidoreductase [Actinomadura yumaensis]|uniref:FAD-binding oxidoreductase n=1 Tax=Actinomadura yumaensis TaxID=111807 RepID=A0ABW2CCD5_9ACTN
MRRDGARRRALLKAAALGSVAAGAAAAGAAAGCSPGGGSGPSARPSSRRPRATAPTGPADWDALARGLEGRLIRPGDAAYAEARRLYIPRFDRVRPAGIAYCGTPEDVAECLAFAARRRLPVAARSGGHSYAGWSTGTGLVVDVSPLDRVRPDGDRAAVGAGTRLIDLYDRLAGAGLGVPGGTCPTVGVAGLALGGGLGVTGRAYGLTCDVLESVRIVTADGRILDCDAHRDADLYWASRGGGGGNFGVAVEFAFRTHRVDDVTPFFLRWPWSRAADVIRGWQRWAPSAPDELWTSLQLNTEPDAGTPSIEIAGVALAGARGHLDRLTAAAGSDPSSSDVRTRPYLDAMRLLAGCAGQTTGQCHARGTLPGQSPEGRFPRTDYAGASHIAFKPLPDDGIDALLRRFAQGNAVGDRSVLMDAMGGAIGRVGPGDTAFAHRAGLFCVQYLAPDGAWLRGAHGAMEPYWGGAAYVNYIDPGLPGWRRAYYGANADRLAKVKAAYDPGRLFRFPQAI